MKFWSPLRLFCTILLPPLLPVERFADPPSQEKNLEKSSPLHHPDLAKVVESLQAAPFQWCWLSSLVEYLLVSLGKEWNYVIIYQPRFHPFLWHFFWGGYNFDWKTPPKKDTNISIRNHQNYPLSMGNSSIILIACYVSFTGNREVLHMMCGKKKREPQVPLSSTYLVEPWSKKKHRRIDQPSLTINKFCVHLIFLPKTRKGALASRKLTSASNPWERKG